MRSKITHRYFQYQLDQQFQDRRKTKINQTV